MDLFERLKQEKRNILLYGMGNGGDKVIAELEKYGLAAAAVFASDAFVRGQLFHGMHVMRFADVRERYRPENSVILLGFGSSRPEVLENIRAIASEYEVLVPDLPVCGGAVFNGAFFNAHKSEIEAAQALFADEASKTLFDAIISYRLTGKLDILLGAVSQKSAWDYLADARGDIRRIADLGAYNGDSAREAIARFSPDFILAAEPDPKTFKKLLAWSEGVEDCQVECHEVAIGDACGEARFDNAGNRNAGLSTANLEKGAQGTTVKTATLDALLKGRAVDYIKYDVEGAEKAALAGSRETILTHRPALRVALYHRSGDLFEIPLILRELCPDHAFYLTREQGFPAWDIDLVAIPK